LKIARSLTGKEVQVVLIDKNNYHQFQPLFYQVATAGLEPSTISFPLRKVFQKQKNLFIRVAEVTSVETESKTIYTSTGPIGYDYLVIALGADTNFFGNEGIRAHALPMKSVSEALAIRNHILENYEKALSSEIEADRDALMNIVVVGGGPTGVEVSGTLGEMKKYILPKDYPELDFNKMNVYLLEGSGRLLNGMTEIASRKSKEYLETRGIHVQLNCTVKDYDGEYIVLADGTRIRSRTLIWAAGISGNKLNGLPPETIGRGGRILVDAYNQVNGVSGVYAIGDVALMATEEKYPQGHPQVAQVAMQQAKNLADNLLADIHSKPKQPFHYKNLGSMATIGRNRAVADLPFIHFQGFFAWLVWMFIHLMSIVGVKNRLFAFINWAWSYVTYDQSLRLIIKQENKGETKSGG
jgi:NADH dehydrogenase